MFGRYALYGPHSRYREQFATANDSDLAPRFNIAPSQLVPIVRLSPGDPLMANIHSRMPAILRPQDYELWREPEMANVERLQAILGPYPERLMEAYPVSRRVNRATEDDAGLIEPVP